MTKIYGYGEDALTLWSMTTGLSRFLTKLDDSTPPHKTTVYFRPSFGRRSRNSYGKSSVFGEFDAIVSTTIANYLIETKWNRSTEYQKNSLKVTDGQVRRHNVMRWYLEKWSKSEISSWADFRSIHRESFESEFKGLTIPTAGTVLARNLKFILTALASKGLPLHDILLYATLAKENAPTTVTPRRFRLVTLHIGSIGNTGFIRLLDAEPESGHVRK